MGKHLSQELSHEPSLFWLAASPDGLVAYHTSDKKLLLEIKCPKTKTHISPIDLAEDQNFYVKLENGRLILKKVRFYWALLTNSASNGTFRF